MTDTLLELLQTACERDPDAAALVGRDGRLSYGEMARIVRRVARYVDATAPAGQAVAVLLPQTPLGVAGVLGCCASGRVCIVLNATDPAERVSTILADARPGAVVTDSTYDASPQLPAEICHLTLQDALTSEDAIGWRASVAPGLDGPAFVYATSGSTGRPKGIVVAMRGMLFRATASAESLQLTPASVVLSTNPASEAGGFGFVLATLFAGGCSLVLDLARDGATALFRLAARERASVLIASPPLMRMLLRLPAAREAFASLRMLRSGSAGLPQSDHALWRASLPAGCIVNHTYASTEAMIVAEWYVPPDYADQSMYLPMGFPRHEHELAVLDEAGCPVDPGEAGELTITSPYIAVGEWQGGGLIEGRMTPVEGRPGWRAFRTGDVMRLGPDGLLRFVSRIDRQLKLNAVRVEPAEIEAILRREPGVTDAVVSPRKHAGAVLLDAFVEAPGQNAKAMHAALETRVADALPRAMRPGRLIVVESFPMLGGTKVDMLALRALAPRSSIE